jgi:hypothetical protein
MKAKIFYEQYNIRALYELPTGLVALKEEDLFKLMEDYGKLCFDAGRSHLDVYGFSEDETKFTYNLFENFVNPKSPVDEAVKELIETITESEDN